MSDQPETIEQHWDVQQQDALGAWYPTRTGKTLDLAESYLVARRKDFPAARLRIVHYKTTAVVVTTSEPRGNR